MNFYPFTIKNVRILFLGWLLLASHFVLATEDPRALVMRTSENLVDRLIESQQKIKSEPQFAFSLANETILPYVDFVKISQWVLGKHWREATPDQQKRFAAAFEEFIVNTYVTAMVTYSDEIIRESKNVSFPENKTKVENDKAQVVSVIQISGGSKVEVGYRLYLGKDGWKIYDVVIEGISLAITYRSNFNQEIAKLSLDGLIESLVSKNLAAKREPLKPIPLKNS